MLREFICSECQKKCMIDVDSEESLDDAACCILDEKKGILTTLVRIKGAEVNVVPVKTTEPIDKSLWVECSKALSRLYVGAPIHIGDVVCKNLLNTGVDVICTKNILKHK